MERRVGCGDTALAMRLGENRSATDADGARGLGSRSSALVVNWRSTLETWAEVTRRATVFEVGNASRR